MQALAAGAAASHGGLRAALAFLLGALATAAMPPVSFTPVLLVSFTGLAWLLDGARGWRRAALDGYLFGFGFFTTGLYWTANALLTDPVRFGWLVPFAVFGIPAILAPFPAAGVVLSRLLWRPGPGRILALAVGWSATEFARGVLFTGFPWNLIGYTWTWSDAVLQTTAAFGVYGLGFFTVLVAASPAALASDASTFRKWMPAGAAAVSLALVFAAGMARLSSANDATVPDVTLRIVQANIAQPHKWDEQRRADNIERILTLAAAPDLEAVTHIVLPETAIPAFLDLDEDLRARLGALLPPGGLLLTGVPRTELPAPDEPAQLWNSIQVLDPSGRIAATYDKAHLVPFGEYVPFRPVLGALGLGTIVPGTTDYSAGPGPRTLAVPGLPTFSPLVCYEVIFPGAVVTAGERPRWLLNVTNDAWYGNSSGPHQHFAMARVRAVEEGLPLVRAANTGISGVIDAYGRIRARLGLGETGVLDAPLPAALARPTWYARGGNVIPVTFLIVGVLVLAGTKIRWLLWPPRGLPT